MVDMAVRIAHRKKMIPITLIAALFSIVDSAPAGELYATGQVSRLHCFKV